MLVELWQFLVADGLIFPDFRVDCFILIVTIGCIGELFFWQHLQKGREKREKSIYILQLNFFGILTDNIRS